MGGGSGGTCGQADPLVGGAMSDRIGKLLEKVALEVSDDVEGFGGAATNAQIHRANIRLEACLGPLLRAGQAMRDFEMEHPSAFTRWDAALATLEGRE